MKNEPEIVDLDLAAKEEYVVVARVLTSLIAKRIGFDKDKQEDMGIAVGEACINVIQHAYKSNHNFNPRLQLRYLRYHQRLVIVVKDFGQGFDPYFVQQYIKRADIEKPERIGLGIFLIKTLMDEVEYDSNPAMGTQVRMTKYK